MSQSSKMMQASPAQRVERQAFSGESFLLRLWKESSKRSGSDCLRITARQLRTGELRQFAEISDLDRYLMNKLNARKAEVDGLEPGIEVANVSAQKG